MCNSVLASGWYVSSGIGQSNANYDAEGKLKERIEETDRADLVRDLEYLEFPIVVTSTMRDRSYKFLLGYHLTPNWSMEGAYSDFGEYTINADLNVQADATVLDHELEVHATIDADAVIAIKSLSLSFIRSWGNPNEDLVIFNKFGVSQLTGTVSSTAYVDYGYSVTGSLNYSQSESSFTTKNKYVTGYAPHIGMGLRYTINDKYSVRIEYIRYGHFINGLRVDNMTIGFIHEL